MNVRVYFWALNSVTPTGLSLCQYHNVLITTVVRFEILVRFEIGKCQCSNLMLFRIVFGYSGYLEFTDEYQNQSVNILQSSQLEIWYTLGWIYTAAWEQQATRSHGIFSCPWTLPLSIISASYLLLEHLTLFRVRVLDAFCQVYLQIFSMFLFFLKWHFETSISKCSFLV